MAERPVFIPVERPPFVHVEPVEFEWYAGFSKSQKQRSFRSLHRAAITKHGLVGPLEISSKSLQSLGTSLSAFHLELDITVPPFRACVEVVYQASKVFEEGGPFLDLLDQDPRSAKRDERLRSSGTLKGFLWHDRLCPLDPKTAFYDWVYFRALNDNPLYGTALLDYGFFTDIEFNPERSVNCQAHAAAVYVGMTRAGIAPQSLAGFDDFVHLIEPHAPASTRWAQGTLDF
ncbi:MAG: DarT1-associated NADAR antitoxin family protein [Fimbriimonas sp.]